MEDLTQISSDRLESLLDARRTDYEVASTKEHHARESANAIRRELSKASRARYELAKLVNAVIAEKQRRSRLLDNIGR
jgi:hypothetical protein